MAAVVVAIADKLAFLFEEQSILTSRASAEDQVF